MIRSFDIAVIGGSLGGVQAARAVCMHGMHVYMCESTDWIGGQMTAQAVPPDEHRWINEQGATKSYMAYRQSVMDAYRSDPAASDLLKSQTRFSPGKAWVSHLAHDPRLALRLLQESLSPFVEQGLLVIELNTRCLEAEVKDDKVLSVTVGQTRRRDPGQDQRCLFPGCHGHR